jgi:hypothetical protein
VDHITHVDPIGKGNVKIAVSITEMLSCSLYLCRLFQFFMITVFMEQNKKFISAVIMTGEALKDCVQKTLNIVDAQYITPCCMERSDILCWCSLPQYCYIFFALCKCL